ncbi:MAG: hypothetical protein ACK57Y_03545, partial [Pirellulaceae bacterium]
MNSMMPESWLASWASGVVRNGLVALLIGQLASSFSWGSPQEIPEALAEGQSLPADYSIPLIDLSGQKERQVIVDRMAGQYLGHPTTVLLEDGKTILCVYPEGHGKGKIRLKRSEDGGKSWGEPLPVPENWATSQETPTIHRVVDAQGNKRLLLWSGLYPARISHSEDDGKTWSPLEPAGAWGGIVVMASLQARQEPGHYIAL